jgi:hypothetical protein
MSSFRALPTAIQFLAMVREHGVGRVGKRGSHAETLKGSGIMDTQTLLIIVILFLLLGGGGWYGRGRWF